MKFFTFCIVITVKTTVDKKWQKYKQIIPEKYAHFGIAQFGPHAFRPKMRWLRRPKSEAQILPQWGQTRPARVAAVAACLRARRSLAACSDAAVRSSSSIYLDKTKHKCQGHVGTNLSGRQTNDKVGQLYRSSDSCFTGIRPKAHVKLHSSLSSASCSRSDTGMLHCLSSDFMWSELRNFGRPTGRCPRRSSP